MLRIIAKALLILLLVALAWYCGGRLRDRSAVRRMEQTVRKQGDPLTVAQLAASIRKVPDEQNAAIPLMDLWAGQDPAYWTAFRKGEHPTAARVERSYDPQLPYLGKAPRVAAGERLSAASQFALELFLQTHSNHFHAVRKALQRPACVFPIQFEETYDALLPHLAALKEEAQSFRLLALAAGQRGDVPAALEAIRDVLRVSELLTDEPLLISQLVRVACVGTALQGAEDLVSRRQLSDEELRVLQTLLRSPQPRKMLRAAITSERAMSLSIFTHHAAAFTSVTDAEMPSPADFNRLRTFFSLMGLGVADRRLTLQVTQEAAALADDTSTNAFQRLKGLITLAAKTRGVPPKIFSSMLMPPLASACGRFLGLEARLQAANVALAIERYRLQRGILPNNLAELVPGELPQLPFDPFDLQPFRYQRFTTGYIVYSIGRDFNDGGGKLKTTSGRAEDETFTVNR